MGSSTSLLKRFHFGTICRKIHRLKRKHYWKQLWYWWKICKRVLRALWLKWTAIKTSKLSRVNQKNQMKSQDRPCGNHSWGMVRVCAKKRSNQSRQGVHLKENNQSRTQGRFENISQDTHTEQVSQNRSSRIHRKLNISSSWTITSSDQGSPRAKWKIKSHIPLVVLRTRACHKSCSIRSVIWRKKYTVINPG